MNVRVAEKEKRKKFNYRNKIQRLTPIILFVVLFVVLAAVNKNFLRAQALLNLSLQVAPTAIISLGAMFVMITGGIDFTSGYGLALAGVTAGAMYDKCGNNGWILVLVAIAVGMAIGFINGIIITRMNLHPFIVTLAMMTVSKGLAVMVSEGTSIKLTTPWLLALGKGRILSIFSLSFIVLLVFAAVVWVLLNKTVIGTYAYAIGGNEDTVVYSGIDRKKYKVIAYTFAGFTYGLASIITVSQLTEVTSKISGTVLLDGIAGAVIGGTSMSGGKGTVMGTLFGSLVMVMLSTLLTYLHVDTLLRDVIKGLLIVGILLIDVGLTALSNKKES